MVRIAIGHHRFGGFGLVSASVSMPQQHSPVLNSIDVYPHCNVIFYVVGQYAQIRINRKIAESSQRADAEYFIDLQFGKLQVELLSTLNCRKSQG